MPIFKQRPTATEARQGSPRRMNLRVLAGSLVLALLAGAIFYTILRAPLKVITPPPQQEQPK